MTPDLKPRTEGIKVRFTGPNMGLALIPLPHMPMGKDSLISPCPPCGVIHLVKTIHLWLDDQGHAVVSQKVLDALKNGGKLLIVFISNLIFEKRASLVQLNTLDASSR